MPDASIHPTPQQLADFGLGKLPERAAAAVAAHLESCPACGKAVAAVPPDSFLGKVRAAGPDGSSFPPGLARPDYAQSSAGRPAIAVVPSPDVPPELVRHPKYLILRELGRGGMGVVYQARQTVMNRPVVIKVINRSLLERPGVLERFRREIQAAARLSHPNIVTAYDAEQAGDLHMLVMEFVPGQSLAEVLEKKGPLPVSHACHFARQVALGLQHAHERNLVHRDIKPQNLILSLKNQIKILDFGLAKVVREESTSTGLTSSDSCMGTAEYMAPEQAKNARSADIRADLYSLGCTLYCLLAGRPPFREDTWMNTVLAHIQKEPQPLTELRSDVPAALWQVVARLLAKEPAQRYQKPIEVVQALAPFVKPGTKPVVKSVSSPPPGVKSPVNGTVIEANTNEVKKILRSVPGKASSKEVPAKVEASPFENLENRPALPKKAKGTRESTKRMPSGWYRRWPVLVGVGVLLLMLLGMWASDVFVRTRYGTIVLENLPEGAEVRIDGEIVTLKAQDGKTFTITARKKHQLQVEKDGCKFFVPEVEINAGESRRIRVTLQPNPRQPPTPHADDKDFVQLFNGKDTAGWKEFGGGAGNWRVEDGVLIGSGPTSHLFSERGDYENFRFRVEAMINDGGNSGQYFRTEFGPRFPKGYEAQINSTHGDTIRTGSLYPSFGKLSSEERDKIIVKDQLVKPNEWFTQEVVANGNHIVIKVNGKTTVDFVDDKNTYKKGHFALQQHDPATVVKFRKIEIKELPPPRATPDRQGAADQKNPVVVMETSMGTIKIELNLEKAPITVKNFLSYVDDKFYDGLTFHRVISDFMIQGGGFERGLKDAKGENEINSKKKKTRDPIKNESGNGLSNTRGTIAMARTPDLNSATAQFFINVKDNPGLDDEKYCVFGKVIDGMDVVDKIKNVRTKKIAIGGKVMMDNVPVEEVVIKSILPALKSAKPSEQGFAPPFNGKDNEGKNLPPKEGTGKQGDAETLTERGRALMDKGNLDRAIEEFRRAIQLNKNHHGAHCNLANALSQKGKVEEAISEYQRAIELKKNGKDCPVAHCNLGTELYAKGDREGAIAAYRKAIALKPDFAVAYNGLGTALVRQKKYADAETALRKAIALKPDFAAYVNLGAALFEQQKYSEAEASFRKAIELKPNSAKAYKDLGLALRRQGKGAEAEAALRKASELKPD